MIYLDNAASAPVLECAIKAAQPFLTECCGNPSSIHSEGRRAALALIEAREKRKRYASLACGLGMLSGIGVFIILF